MRAIEEVTERIWTPLRGWAHPKLGEEKLVTLLEEHADAMVRGETALVERAADISDEVAVLLSLAERVYQAFTPVKPSPTFEKRLYGELMREARQHMACSESTVWATRRKEMIVGGTLACVLSLAGLVYFLYSHLVNHHPAAPLAGES